MKYKFDIFKSLDRIDTNVHITSRLKSEYKYFVWENDQFPSNMQRRPANDEDIYIPITRSIIPSGDEAELRILDKYYAAGLDENISQVPSIAKRPVLESILFINDQELLEKMYDDLVKINKAIHDKNILEIKIRIRSEAGNSFCNRISKKSQ